MLESGAKSGGDARTTEYVVVARRYRPQSFADLVGQATVSQALCNAITTDRVGHAYLFTGARGVGKTSTARILAKSLNCETGPTTTPCGECDICQQIANGDDVDVLEIDGASNRGIDEIRQLRSNVGIRPSRARFKVYIIDEVHMLTKEAFNALLKTLEEPPDHVKFVFCTTEPGKIPVTVLSRCQRFDFAPVMTAEIVQRLQFIVEHEGAQAEPEALELLARRAAGSMRDSQSLLEQLLSFVNEPITVDHVHAMLGTARDERLQGILHAVNARDAAGALASLNEALLEGVDVGQLAEQLVGCLRDLMAVQVGGGGELLLYHAPSQLEELREAGSSWGLETLMASVQILDQAVTRMRQSIHGRILMELALVRIAHLENLDLLAGLIQQLGQIEAKGGSLPIRVAVSDLPSPPPAKKKMSGVEAAPESGQTQAGPGHESASDVDPTRASAEARHGPLTEAEARRLWLGALEQLNDLTADHAGMAEAVASSGPNRLVVRFQQVYTSSKTFCERPERRQALEAALSQFAGRSLRLEFELLRGDPPHELPAPPKISRQQQRQQVARHPLVERAVELFGAEVMNVEVVRTGERAPQSGPRGSSR